MLGTRLMVMRSQMWMVPMRPTMVCAFIEHVKRGLGLSQKVWRWVKSLVQPQKWDSYDQNLAETPENRWRRYSHHIIPLF